MWGHWATLANSFASGGFRPFGKRFSEHTGNRRNGRYFRLRSQTGRPLLHRTAHLRHYRFQRGSLGLPKVLHPHRHSVGTDSSVNSCRIEVLHLDNVHSPREEVLVCTVAAVDNTVRLDAVEVLDFDIEEVFDNFAVVGRALVLGDTIERESGDTFD